MNVKRSSSPICSRARSSASGFAAACSRPSARSSAQRLDRVDVLRPRVLDLRQQLVVLDEAADDVRVLEDVAALGGGARRIDRSRDGADLREREVEQHPLEPGAREHAEGVALLDAQGEQAVRELVDRLRGLGLRDLAPAAVLLDQIGRARALLGERVLPERPDRPHLQQKITGGEQAVQVQLVLLMRTIWNGSISFGLVNIPVGLALATKPAARQSDVSFRQLHRECMTPIKQKRWCEVHDREVERDEIVKGWEVAKGEFVARRGRRPRGDHADRRLEVDRDHALRRRGRSRSRLLRPHVLPRAGERDGGAATVRAPAARHAGDREGCARAVRPPGRGAPLPDPPEGRCARARDDVPRRGRELPGRDRGGRRRAAR